MEIELYGNSMSPLICDKDKIKVKIYDQPQEIIHSLDGTILLFHDKEEWVSHRLIKVGHQLFLKGDFSYNTEQVHNQLAWGEIIEIKSLNKTIDPNKFTKLILYFSRLQINSNNKKVKKILKLSILILNKINRTLTMH